MQAKLTGVQAKLQDWDQNVFGSVKKSLVAIRQELEQE
jgi:hypothetical protein